MKNKTAKSSKLYPPFPEYVEKLKRWSDKYPELLSVTERGKSVRGLPIFLVRITDPMTPLSEKDIVLVTALHSGEERSATTTILRLIEWLLAGTPAAGEILRKQVVLLMPMVNPDGYCIREGMMNLRGIDPYTGRKYNRSGCYGNCWNMRTLTLKTPGECPELVAFKGVVDEFQPEVCVDNHGIRLRYPGQMMFESVGSACSNSSLRPFDWRVTEKMIEEGNKAGYGYSRLDASDQRIFLGKEYESLSGRCWSGRPYFYSSMYAYFRYHSLLAVQEIAWEQSGLARLRGLLSVGNGPWEGEFYAGYPVNIIKSLCHYSVVSYGASALHRRKSRAELWGKQEGFALGVLYPQTNGRIMFACATGKKEEGILCSEPSEFLTRLKKTAMCRACEIERFIRKGPETELYVQSAEVPSDVRIENGMALRLTIPCKGPKIKAVWLNGFPLKKNCQDGFNRWYGDGFTNVQVNIPPEKTRKEGLFIVTCEYAFSSKDRSSYAGGSFV